MCELGECFSLGIVVRQGSLLLCSLELIVASFIGMVTSLACDCLSDVVLLKTKSERERERERELLVYFT